MRHGSAGLRVRTDPSAIAAWHGRADFLCPPGSTLGTVLIAGRGGGGLCSEPSPPSDAFVRIAHLESVATWSLATSSDPVVAHTGIASADRYLTYDLLVASARPLHIVAELVPGADAPLTARPVVTGGRAEPPPDAADGPDAGAPARVRRYTFQILAQTSASGRPLTASFVVHATAYGFCTTPGPCGPPPGETVRVLSVELRR